MVPAARRLVPLETERGVVVKIRIAQKIQWAARRGDVRSNLFHHGRLRSLWRRALRSYKPPFPRFKRTA